MTMKPWLDLYPAEISKTLDYERHSYSGIPDKIQ